MKTVPVSDWGVDHWSLLLYMEALCVDSSRKGIGEIDKRRMRTNERRHRIHAVNMNMGVGKWKPEYGTRLGGYWDKSENPVVKRQIKGHDDWDILNDLEAAGLIEVISEANGFVLMSEKGMKLAAEVRAYKAKGGRLRGFRWAESEVLEKVL
jgi:hypothetical protein